MIRRATTWGIAMGGIKAIKTGIPASFMHLRQPWESTLCVFTSFKEEKEGNLQECKTTKALISKIENTELLVGSSETF